MPDDLIDLGAAMDPQPAPVYTPEIVPAPLPDFPAPSGFDLAPLSLSLVPYQQKVKALAVAAQNIRVEDESGRKQATDLALVAKRLRLKVEAIKKSEPYLAADVFVKDIRHLCNTLTDPLKNQVETVCKNKLTAYSEQLRLAQQRREAAAREEARQLQAKLDAEAKKLRDDALALARAAADELAKKEAAGNLKEGEKAILEQTVIDETAAAESVVSPQVVVQVQPADNVVRTDAGASFTRARWKPRLIDPALVEEKYKVIDLRLVQKDVDGGMRKISGFIIEEELSTSLRG